MAHRIKPPSSLWAIEAGYAGWAESLLMAVDIRAQGGLWDDSRPAYTVTRQGVAILELSGPLTKNPHCLQSIFGGTAMADTLAGYKAALSDPSVRAVCLYLDSPGGEVAGTAELAEAVASCPLPTLAFVSDLCCSAAYWIAAQCDRIVANSPGALVGSIGVRTSVRDMSAAFARAGVTVHAVATGKYKAAGEAGTEITEEHLADFQRLIDALGQEFVTAVADGRGVPAEAAQAWADGRVYTARDALAMGLIDAIDTWDSALLSLPTLSRGANPAQEKPTMSFIDSVKGLFRSAGIPEETIAQALTESESAPAATTPLAPPTAAAADIAALREMIVAQSAQITALTMQMQAERQNAALTASNERINTLVRQMKITPAQAESYRALARDNSAGFEAIYPALAELPANPKIARQGLVHMSGNAAGNAGEQLTALAAKRAKETGEPLSAALIAVANENPELARAHAESAPRYEGSR